MGCFTGVFRKCARALARVPEAEPTIESLVVDQPVVETVQPDVRTAPVREGGAERLPRYEECMDQVRMR